MKITPSPFAVRPARPLPPPPGTAVPPPAAPPALAADVLAAGALGTATIAPADLLEQCGEGVVTALDACGEGRAWPLASSGGAAAMLLGGLHFAEARRHGDGAEMRVALLKMGAGGLGVVAGSGVFAAYPTVQGGLEVARLVLASITAEDLRPEEPLSWPAAVTTVTPS